MTVPTPGVLIDGPALAAALDLDYDQDETTFDQVAAAAGTVTGALLTTTVDHSGHDACREAAVHVAVELYTARSAVGGQSMGVDWTPGPRLSAWVTRRVVVLVGPCLNVKTMVG